MSSSKHNRPRPKGFSWVGELLILFGILLLGLALLTLPAGAVFRAPPNDVIALPNDAVAPPTSQSTPASPVATAVPSLVAMVPTATPPVKPTPSPTPTVSAIATPAPATPPAVSQPLPTPASPPPAATHIAIPSVGIDANVQEVGYQLVSINGQQVRQLQVAAYAAGHDELSANPGTGGNVVIAGHDDWKGEVFKNLHDVKLGDPVLLTTPAATHRYVVTGIFYRQYTDTSLTDRLAAGQFLAPMPEERVTLVTCWPYGVDTHRLIVVAKPQAPAP